MELANHVERFNQFVEERRNDTRAASPAQRYHASAIREVLWAKVDQIISAGTPRCGLATIAPRVVKLGFRLAAYSEMAGLDPSSLSTLIKAVVPSVTRQLARQRGDLAFGMGRLAESHPAGQPHPNDAPAHP